MWSYVEKVYQDEEQQPNEPDFKEINPLAVSEAISAINEALREKEIDPKVKQKLNYAKKNWPGKLTEYETREKQLKGRNSLSKTDPDASFMRMKEDHMRNGQLKLATTYRHLPQGITFSTTLWTDDERHLSLKRSHRRLYRSLRTNAREPDGGRRIRK